MVFEEDTFRILSAGNHIREIREPLEELQQRAVRQQPVRTGDLVMRGSRWFAILHDFDSATPFDESAITIVLDQMAEHIEALGLTAIGIQALGAHHGPEELSVAVSRLRDRHWPDCLERIWIVSGGE